LYDKQNNVYGISIVAQDHDFFHADILTENALVGQIRWMVSEPHILELADLVIFEQAIVFRRGCLRYIPFLSQPQPNFRHLGLGTAMLEYVIAQAKALGMKGIYGEVTHDDAMKTPYLIEWYQRHGFTVGHEPKRLPNAVATIYREIYQ
jgi:GNAT superfamily N-acetyltransferase